MCGHTIIEYAATVWDPHISILSRNIHSGWYNEELRDGSPTYTIINTSSVSDILHTLGWISLEHRLATSRLCHGSIGIPHYPYISSHTDIIHDPRVKRDMQRGLPSQHTSAGLTILNVLSSTKQLLLGMHPLKVWSLAPHLRHCHWGDRYQASVFEHTNISCFSLPTYFNPAFILRLYLSFILLLSTVYSPIY